jgi:hypothetical protein
MTKNLILKEGKGYRSYAPKHHNIQVFRRVDKKLHAFHTLTVGGGKFSASEYNAMSSGKQFLVPDRYRAA